MSTVLLGKGGISPLVVSPPMAPLTDEDLLYHCHLFLTQILLSQVSDVAVNISDLISKHRLDGYINA